MNSRIRRGAVAGFDAIVLESDRLRAVIIPSLGGRVWELEDRLHRRQWIWHRPDVPLQACPVGTAYDDVWAGGWEELFPNDAPGEFEGRFLPDHGEWWAMAWSEVDSAEGAEPTLTLQATSSVIRARCRKQFRLSDDGSALTLTYRIQSLEDRPFHFLFKQHLPVAITPACRLLLPGGRAEPVDPSFSRMVPDGRSFDWPGHADNEGSFDASRIPGSARGLQEFLYVSDLPEAWCGVDDELHGARLRLDFDAQALPYVWLFLTYGGWRGLYTAVLEPCSNKPKDLANAVRAGHAARLGPGEEFVTAVTVTLSERLEADR